MSVYLCPPLCYTEWIPVMCITGILQSLNFFVVFLVAIAWFLHKTQECCEAAIWSKNLWSEILQPSLHGKGVFVGSLPTWSHEYTTDYRVSTVYTGCGNAWPRMCPEHCAEPYQVSPLLMDCQSLDTPCSINGNLHSLQLKCAQSIYKLPSPLSCFHDPCVWESIGILFIIENRKWSGQKMVINSTTSEHCETMQQLREKVPSVAKYVTSL